MLRKIVTSIILILLIALIGQYYNIHQGSIIILTQQSKITINLAMGIVLSIVGFVVLYYCLRFLAFLRTSPSNWRKYRQQKSLVKHQENINKALLHLLQDEHSQAEVLFKQNYLSQSDQHSVDLLMAVYTELKDQQIPQAQNDLSDLRSTDTTIRAAANFLQIRIYQEKNQPKSAINTIKQDKYYLKKRQLLERLCQCLLDSKQYHELIALLNQRMALSYDEKKIWTLRAHQAILDGFLCKNQTTEALAHLKQLTSQLLREPAIISRHIHTLILQNNYADAEKLVEKHFTSLITSPDYQAIIHLINVVNKKDFISKIEQWIENILNQPTVNKQYAYQCHAHIMVNKQLFEKAIADNLALINLNLSTKQSIDARINIHQLEKKIKPHSKT